MNRLLLAFLFLAAAAGFMVYARTQPRHEVRSAVNELPADLRLQAVPASQLELGDRLLKVTWRLREHSDKNAMSQRLLETPERYRLLFAGNWLKQADLDAIRSIFDEGRPEVDVTRFAENTIERNRANKSLAAFPLVVSSVITQTWEALKRGDTEACAQDLILAIKLADWSGTSTPTGPQFNRQHVGLLAEYVAFNGRLSAKQWRAVLDAIPPTSQIDPVLERNIRSELAGEIKSMSESPPGSTAGGQTRPYGTFDRDETIRDLIDIRRLDLQNARLARFSRSPAVIEYVANLQGGLPPRPVEFDPGESPGPEPNTHSKQYLADFEKYARKMDAGKNTLGRQMLFALSDPAQERGPGSIFLSSYSARTFLEKQRALAAIMVFRQEHGHLPATLDDLVRADILAAVPHDYLSRWPLHYNANAKRIWSAGENGINDGGNVRLNDSDDWATLLPG